MAVACIVHNCLVYIEGALGQNTKSEISPPPVQGPRFLQHLQYWSQNHEVAMTRSQVDRQDLIFVFLSSALMESAEAGSGWKAADRSGGRHILPSETLFET